MRTLAPDASVQTKRSSAGSGADGSSTRWPRLRVSGMISSSRMPRRRRECSITALATWPTGAPDAWHPRLLDYTYLAFVTAIAWSAADTLPLSRRAKVLMAIETGIAALTILLVAARAVSIFG